MIVQHRENAHKGTFFIEENGLVRAELTYSFAGGKLLIIDHTRVSDSLRGKGIATTLVDSAVSYVRNTGAKIVPLCPFAKRIFDETPAYRDVLYTKESAPPSDKNKNSSG